MIIGFFLINGCGRWLFLEVKVILLLLVGVMAAGCCSELRGGCFWEVIMY